MRNKRLLSLLRLALSGAMGFLVFAGPLCLRAEGVRVKDLGKVKGWRDNALVGYSIVTGLAGTGDSPSNPITREALSNVLSQFNLKIPVDEIQSRNTAVVLVSAELPPFARPGDTLDVTVTSIGDARSLAGGYLLLAPLKGANDRTYALAEGPLSVGGYRYDANGNMIQKNHPTTASIPNGGKVEVGMDSPILDADQSLTFVLDNPDFGTANAITDAINAKLGSGIATAKDAEGIRIKVPDGQKSALVAFMAKLEDISVEPDRRAKVVINERTGTVVSGGDVRISPVAISHGDLRINISTVNTASQPGGFIAGSNPGVQTAIVSNTTLNVNEVNGPGYLAPGSNTVADLVQSLARLSTNTRDIIAILQAIKAAGALHAELIIQ